MKLNAKVKYNKNTYGKEINKEYKSIETISLVKAKDKLIIISNDNNGINNYELDINPTLKIELYIEDE